MQTLTNYFNIFLCHKRYPDDYKLWLHVFIEVVNLILGASMVRNHLLDTILDISFTLTHNKTDAEVMLAAGIRNPLIYKSKGSTPIERQIMVFNENVEKILSYLTRMSGVISFHDRRFSTTTFELDKDLLSQKIITYIHSIMDKTDSTINI